MTLTGVSTGADVGQRVQSHFMAPQVQSSVMAAPQVNVNIHLWAVVSSRPGFMAGFHSLQSGAVVWQHEGHCSMISLRFSCRMVSLTAWKTKRIFSVSIAVVKWWKSGFPRFLLLRLNDCTRNAWKGQSNLSISFESHFLNIIYMRNPVSAIWGRGLDQTWRKSISWPRMRLTRFLICFLCMCMTKTSHREYQQWHFNKAWNSTSTDCYDGAPPFE